MSHSPLVAPHRFGVVSVVARGQALARHSRVRAIGGVAVLVVAFLALTTSSALAAVGHTLTASFGASGTAESQFGAGSPRGMAIDQDTGDVYVADTANSRVERFQADGTFVSAWGWGVADGSPAAQVCTSGCQAGISGSAAGQFSAPTFVAVDNSGGLSDGSVYVADVATNLVQKFDSAGNLIFAWGSGGQLDGSTASNGPFGPIAGIAVDSSGVLDVFDVNTRMFEFTSSGTFLTDFTTVRGTAPGGLAVDGAGNFYKANGDASVEKFDAVGNDIGQVGTSFTATDIAIDPGTGDLYISTASAVERYAFDGSGNVIQPDSSTCTIASFSGCPPTETFAVGDLTAGSGIAVRASTGRVYVADGGANQIDIFDTVILPGVATGTAAVGATTATLNGTVDPASVAVVDCRFEYTDNADFEANGFANATDAACEPDPGSGSGPVEVSADISGLTTGSTYHFRLVATNANGTTQGGAQAFTTPDAPAILSQSNQAIDFDSATVAAQINPSGLATTYRIEYGTDSSYGQSTPESASIGSDYAAHPVSVTLTGLTSGTTYHWRVVATNAIATSVSPDRTFTTLEASAGATDCPNQRFRTGPSAALPDCRAYEMVSPVDKNNGDIKTLPSGFSFRTGLEQASVDGEKLTYSAYKAFGDAVSSPYSSQYIASRGAGGWSTHSINAPRDTTIFSAASEQWDIAAQFKAFTDDLSLAWVFNDNATPLTSDAVEDSVNLYARDNVEDSYRALTIDGPPSTDMYFQGHSSDGSHAVFTDQVARTPDAPVSDEWKLYEVSDGDLRLVSVLPDGTASTESSSAGAWDNDTYRSQDRTTALDHAISDDGSRIFWTARSSREPGSGDLYVRIDGEHTVAISTSGDAFFRAASADGSKVIFDTAPAGGYGNLYEFNVDTGAQRLIADNVRGVLGASDDLSYIYFVSTNDLSAGATEGQNNLYVEHEGVVEFVTGLRPEDVGFRGSDPSVAPNVVGRMPFYRPARVTPDGRHIAFESVGPLTGYDNTEVGTGASAIEVFTYDFDNAKLACASCNPSGGNPLGQALRFPYTATDQARPEVQGGTVAAAWLTTAPNSLYTPRALSDDGSRLFFNSFDALVPGDTNGQQDVYQWTAEGAGGCERSSGCVSLISSGRGAGRSEFIDASADGGDVFFETSSSLVSHDTGLIDIYNARVGGGFAPPPVPPAGCEGEGCQGASPPPTGSAPASAGSGGSGNATSRRKAVLARVRVVRKAVGVTAFSLRVKVAGRGVITGSGRGLRTVRRRVGRAGTYRLAFKLTEKAKRQLADRDAPRVRARVRFAPGAGGGSQTTVVLRLKQPKRAHGTRAAKNDSGGAK